MTGSSSILLWSALNQDFPGLPVVREEWEKSGCGTGREARVNAP